MIKKILLSPEKLWTNSTVIQLLYLYMYNETLN